jgi:hypothetical protein
MSFLFLKWLFTVHSMCYDFLPMFADVAVCVAIQSYLVQQCWYLKGRNYMLELPEVEGTFSGCSLVFVGVRTRLIERVEFSLLFTFGCCQSPVLLSILLSV